MAVIPTTQAESSIKRAAPRVARIPPLENGDRLGRREFERRYQAMPELKKAELIEGVVHMPSPVHYTGHSEPHSQIMTWLGIYATATPGVRAGDNATLRLDSDNEVQPDALLRIDRGGRSRVSGEDYLEGAPELVVEIAASSATNDLRDKLRVYRRNGIQEYLVWRVYDEQVDWFQLIEEEYTPLAPDESGMIRSQVFPGLWLNVNALLDGDLAKVLAVLQQGCQTHEHAEFVARLAQSSSAPG